MLSAVFPAHGILFPIMFKCFPAYNIPGLRLSWFLVVLGLGVFGFFFPLSPLITTLLYSYSLGLLLLFLCSVFYHCFFLSTVKINLFLIETLVKVSLLFIFFKLLWLLHVTCFEQVFCFFTSSNLYLFAVTFSATHIFLLLPFFSLMLSHSCMTPGLHASCMSFHIFCQAAHFEQFAIFHFPFTKLFLYFTSVISALILLYAYSQFCNVFDFCVFTVRSLQ